MYYECIYGGISSRCTVGVVVIMLHILSSFFALQPHQSEHDALIKFMEDLGK